MNTGNTENLDYAQIPEHIDVRTAVRIVLAENGLLPCSNSLLDNPEELETARAGDVRAGKGEQGRR